ncbi:MAG: bifunctional folylpolyglutamate synthase/dihydrofolate synthase [Chloroflexi bacterium]|nr:bifunctional folylpolyglutamate synthase/dihydrofolate synthase [Chloroflexota bacterium]
MNYLEALRSLQRRDDWERTGAPGDAARWDLRRMRSLLARLDSPHLGRRTVHIAGSKGKGSTGAMIASVLKAAGESTGLFTSPHLHRFVERISVAGEPIAPEEFGRLMGELAPQIEAEEADGSYGAVSTFEALTALAFLYFRERDVRWQVLEVGLGGRLDATNVFDEKDVCVITPIGLEHTAILGDTVAQIAEEKAAIVTPGTTVVMAPQRESAAEVVRRVCGERGATLNEVAEACALSRGGSNLDGQEFTLRTPGGTRKLRIPLLGRHQLDNAAAAVLALDAIEIDEAALRDGLATLRWPGRIEVLRRQPLVIADGAHNRDSARALVRTVQDDLGRSSAVLVVGCSGDKDLDALADELAPLATQVVATRSRHPRAVEPREVARVFAERDVPVAVEEPAGAALDAALAQAAGQAVIACGSLFVAAEAREHLLGVEYDPPLELAASGSSSVRAR